VESGRLDNVDGRSPLTITGMSACSCAQLVGIGDGSGKRKSDAVEGDSGHESWPLLVEPNR
jgi:hypothetical protein